MNLFYFTVIPSWIFIIGEIIVTKSKPLHKNAYSIEKFVGNVSALILLVPAESIFSYFHFHFHGKLYERIHLIDFDSSNPAHWIFAYILGDFAYYWYHRAHHRVRLFWAIHEAHHQSEEFNMSMGFKVGVFEPLSTILFFLPLAILGIPGYVLAIVLFTIVKFMFFIHSRYANFGPLDFVLNSGRHHKIHHANDEHCIDKNFGGITIIWDRLFGTFYQSEKTDKLSVGLNYRRDTIDPIRQNIYPFLSLFRELKNENSFLRKLRYLFSPTHNIARIPERSPEKDTTSILRIWNQHWFWFVFFASTLDFSVYLLMRAFHYRSSLGTLFLWSSLILCAYCLWTVWKDLFGNNPRILTPLQKGHDWLFTFLLFAMHTKMLLLPGQTLLAIVIRIWIVLFAVCVWLIGKNGENSRAQIMSR